MSHEKQSSTSIGTTLEGEAENTHASAARSAQNSNGGGSGEAVAGKRAWNFKDRVGEKHGRLTVIAYAGKNSFRNAMWRCICDCGKETIISSGSFNSDGGHSCGCEMSEFITKLKTTHGLVRTRGYKVWESMWSRCKYPSCESYPRYGGRGIKVCERWKSVIAFIEDMGQPPAGMSIERKDNDGDYGPGNCVWATKSQQARNRLTTRLITAFGETMPLCAWSDKTGIGRSTIEQRIKRGWTVERALSAALDPRGRHAR